MDCISLCLLTVDVIEPATSNAYCYDFLTIVNCTSNLNAKNFLPLVAFVKHFVAATK